MAASRKGIFLDRNLNNFISANTMSEEEFERRQAELAAGEEAAAAKERTAQSAELQE